MKKNIREAKDALAEFEEVVQAKQEELSEQVQTRIEYLETVLEAVRELAQGWLIYGPQYTGDYDGTADRCGEQILDILNGE